MANKWRVYRCTRHVELILTLTCTRIPYTVTFVKRFLYMYDNSAGVLQTLTSC